MTWESKYTTEYCEKLPGLFAEGASITKVCRELGIHRDTYYEWKKTHPAFTKAAKLGEMTSQIWWEEHGRKAIFGEVEKFAGSSWQFVMKNRFREDYRDDKSEDKPSDNSDILMKILTGEIKVNQ